MKDKRAVILLLLLPNLANAGFDGGLKIDANNPYEFKLFENFVQTEKAFINETILHDGLKELRSLLRIRRNLVRGLIDVLDSSRIDDDVTAVEFAQHPINAYKMLYGLFHAFMKTPQLDHNQNSALAEFAKIERMDEFLPTLKDYQGAVKGVILLMETYDLDIEKMMQGHLVVQPADSIFGYPDINFDPVREKPDLTDLAVFIRAAYGRHWFDDAIKMMRTYYDLYNKTQAEFRPKNSIHHALDAIRKKSVRLNNEYLTKKQIFCDSTHKILQYTVKDNLKKKKKQPKFQQHPAYANLQSSEGNEFWFRSVCRGLNTRILIGNFNSLGLQCHLLHHDDPYLRLGPFKYEVASNEPFIIVYHELLTEEEMNHLVEKSKPNLSSSRELDSGNVGSMHEFKTGRKRKIIHKTVQYWMSDVKYNNQPSNLEEHDEDNDDSYEITDPILLKLSRKFERATNLNITGKHSSSRYQVTNYGLAGLCETHIDPHGYLDDIPPELPHHKKHLQIDGDMIATLMGWIADEPKGGATAFHHPGNEVTIWPKKGSVAFWYGVTKKGNRDVYTSHGGCPVIQGSKWILNKWIYYFDQFSRHPCSLSRHDRIPPFTEHY